MGVNRLEQRRSQLVALQQVAEVENGRLVGDGLRQRETAEAAHRLGLVQAVLHGRGALVVAELHQVDAQHHRQRVGRNGQTPGKRLLGIGVINEEGDVPPLGAMLARGWVLDSWARPNSLRETVWEVAQGDAARHIETLTSRVEAVLGELAALPPAAE